MPCWESLSVVRSRGRSLRAKMSKRELHPKLNLPGRTQIAARRACGGNTAEIWGRHGAIGLCKVRMIEDVECLGTELKIDSFLNECVFGDGQVDVLKTRSLNDIAAGIAEPPWMAHKGKFVKEQFRRRVRQRDRLARNQIRAIEIEQASAAASIQKQRNDGAERISGLQIHNRRKAPSLCQPAEECAFGLDRQYVNAAQNEAMTRIKVRTGAL